jgi:alpha-L-fucosidase
MNDSWGYNVTDTNWKSPRRLIHTLCEVAGKGGNLLLNVGPRGDGTLQPEVSERLAAIEEWMGDNAESIIGTEPGLEAWQWYGPSTRRAQTVFLHALMRPEEFVAVRGVHTKRLRSVRSLTTGESLPFETRTSIIDIRNPDPAGEVIIAVPTAATDPYATVFALDFAEGPQ